TPPRLIPQQPLTNVDIIKLVSARLSDEVIIAKLRSSQVNFDTSTAGLIMLKQAKVPDSVMLAMIPPPPRDTRPIGNNTVQRGQITDDLTSDFKRLQTSVVTVWSEFGYGTGFIFDRRGLILTNQHIVGASRYIAVQFDARRKVAARVLAESV